MSCPRRTSHYWDFAGIRLHNCWAAQRHAGLALNGPWMSLRPSGLRCGARTLASAVACRLEVPEHAGAQLGLLRRRPGAETFAGLHAELAVRYELFEIRRRPRPRVDRGQHDLVDREGEIGADEVGVLQWAEHREPPPERRLDDGVDCLGVADAVLD